MLEARTTVPAAQRPNATPHRTTQMSPPAVRRCHLCLSAPTPCSHCCRFLGSDFVKCVVWLPMFCCQAIILQAAAEVQQLRLGPWPAACCRGHRHCSATGLPAPCEAAVCWSAVCWSAVCCAAQLLHCRQPSRTPHPPSMGRPLPLKMRPSMSRDTGVFSTCSSSSRRRRQQHAEQLHRCSASHIVQSSAVGTRCFRTGAVTRCCTRKLSYSAVIQHQAGNPLQLLLILQGRMPCSLRRNRFSGWRIFLDCCCWYGKFDTIQDPANCRLSPGKSMLLVGQ